MKRKKLTTTCAVILGALLVAGVVLVWLVVRAARSWERRERERYEKSVTGSVEPMSLEEAREELTVPLPDGAAEIQYACHAYGMVYDFMLKFRAPVEVCKAHALLLLAQHNARVPERAVPAGLRPLTRSPDPETPLPPITVTWWDIHNIKSGFTGGARGNHQPMIWIDADRGLFYLHFWD